MRLSTLCLSLCFLTTQVLASVISGPFESVFFYYVYRIDHLALVGSHAIAKACPGTGPGGVCYFDEFVRYIQPDDHPWTGHTSVGHNLDPDPAEAAKSLMTSGTEGTPTRCSNRYDAHKLFPARVPPGATVSYHEFMPQLVNFVQDCRAVIGDAKLTTALANARRAFGWIYEARIGDMTHFLVEDVNRQLRKYKVPWTCKTFEHELPGGTRVTMVDTLGTLQAHPDVGDEFKKAIVDYVGNYIKPSKGKTHYRTLRALQLAQNVLEGPVCS